MSDRLAGIRYTALNKPDHRLAERAVLFAAEFPGSANYFAPVANLIATQERAVVFQTRGTAEEIIERQFKNRRVDIDALPSTVDWVLLSGGQKLEFEVEAARGTRRVNPKSRIGIAEDSPTSADSVIEALADASFQPDLVLTITREQVRYYRDRFPQLRIPFIPIGQASFDHLFSENTLELSSGARGTLGISTTDTIVTYIGLKGHMVPDAVSKGNYPDFDTYILLESAKATATVASGHPKSNFVFINRPHPGALEEAWSNPQLENLEGLPSNLRLISLSKEAWAGTGLSTRQVTAASDLAINVASTVGQELALAGARPGQNRVTIPLHVLPDDALQEFWLGQFPLGEMGATALVRNVADLPHEIERSLFDSAYRTSILENQKPLINDFRFKASSARRVLLWMSAVDRYGSDVAQALKVFKR